MKEKDDFFFYLIAVIIDNTMEVIIITWSFGLIFWMWFSTGALDGVQTAAYWKTKPLRNLPYSLLYLVLVEPNKNFIGFWCKNGCKSSLSCNRVNLHVAQQNFIRLVGRNFGSDIVGNPIYVSGLHAIILCDSFSICCSHTWQSIALERRSHVTINSPNRETLRKTTIFHGALPWWQIGYEYGKLIIMKLGKTL